MTKAEFFDKMKYTDNYAANILFNAGRWNYHTIYKVTDNDGITWYYANPCKNPSTNLSAVRRICSMN